VFCLYRSLLVITQEYHNDIVTNTILLSCFIRVLGMFHPTFDRRKVAWDHRDVRSISVAFNPMASQRTLTLSRGHQ
jgi:hypothetical protein